MTDPDSIIAGMTEAQKRAVLDAECREDAGPYNPAGLYVRADKRVRYSLAIKNIVRDYLSPSHRLTPLGLTIRTKLQEQSQ